MTYSTPTRRLGCHVWEGCTSEGVPHRFAAPLRGDARERTPGRSCAVCHVREDVWRAQMTAVHGKDPRQWPI